MLVAVMIGRQTPGHSTAEAPAFELGINQPYTDFISLAGWGYLGVYEVEGLVPGAFGEIGGRCQPGLSGCSRNALRLR